MKNSINRKLKMLIPAASNKAIFALRCTGKNGKKRKIAVFVIPNKTFGEAPSKIV